MIPTALLSTQDHGTCQDRLAYAAVINNPQISVPLNQRLLSHPHTCPLPTGRETVRQSHSGIQADGVATPSNVTSHWCQREAERARRVLRQPLKALLTSAHNSEARTSYAAHAARGARGATPQCAQNGPRAGDVWQTTLMTTAVLKGTGQLSI